MTHACSAMSKALACAGLALRVGEVPVGAVITKDGRIIALAHNLTHESGDPTAHAEILAIRAACRQLAERRLTGCDMYVTLEPCAMCAQAIAHARIRRLYYAASDPKGGAVEHGPRLFDQPTCHHRPEIYAGIAERQAAAMLRDFFREKR